MQVYSGESVCTARKANGTPCANKGYYWSNNVVVCGVHSKAATRTKLPVNTVMIQQRLEDHRVSCAITQAHTTGRVISSRLRMMKQVPHVAGFVSVFPNAKHAGRKDGLGMSRLSPMLLGPVQHGQPGLPPAHNLENFWQASKLFPAQVLCTKATHETCGEECFRQYQQEMFTTVKAERHNKYAVSRKVLPLGWVWTRADSTTELYAYVSARQFYCRFYETLARKEQEFETLRQHILQGMSVNIIGYDGGGVTETDDVTSISAQLEALYLDDTRPFGHELCLVAMLLLPNRQDLPWVKHCTQEV